MEPYLKALESVFNTYADKDVACGQKAYLKNQFEFYGIKTPMRRVIQKPFLLPENLPPKSELSGMIKDLWTRPQREYQYFGQELTWKYRKEFDSDDILLFQYMIKHKSWWDTVDFIASKLVGAYFLRYTEQRNEYIPSWIASGNIWLQRSAILFQLNYKTDLDTDLLSSVIHELAGSEEFFIKKAIGWILRQYSKDNPDWVLQFVENTSMSNLSQREALKWLFKQNYGSSLLSKSK